MKSLNAMLVYLMVASESKTILNEIKSIEEKIILYIYIGE